MKFCRAFKSLQQSKKSNSFCCWTFWQGHKDLNPEPTVLETRLINQPLGGLLLKLIFQLSKSKSPPQSQKTIQKSNKLGISETSLRSSGSTVFYAETVGSEIISYPSDFSNNQGAFSCLFWLKLLSITLRYQLLKRILQKHQLSGGFHHLLFSFVSAGNVIKELLKVFHHAWW